MAGAAKSSTVVSTKGQVILPKALRDQNNWGPGTRLVVEQTEAGVLLRRAPYFKPTRIEDVMGMLKYDGPPISNEEMDERLSEAFRRDYGHEYDRD